MTSKTLSITESWLKFDIKTLQSDLDTKVIEIAQQQEDGEQSRKKLIELSKEFKKGASEEVRKAVAPTLKSFQQEIDNLSKRNKTLETLFLNLYKQLIDLPDPTTAFENIQQLQKKAERASDLEIENEKLRETLNEYNEEFAHVKNQEVTIKQLKEKIKDLEEKSEQIIQTRVKEKEKELQKIYNEKDEQTKTTQFDLVKKLGDTETKNASLQAQLTKIQTEIYELKNKQDELLNAKKCEIDILLQDLDKVNDRAVNAERLLEQYISDQEKKMSQELLSSQAQTPVSVNIQNSIDHITTTTLEIELAAKEKEISQLVDDMQKLQFKSNKTRELYESEKQNYEEKLNRKDERIQQLEEQCKLKEDYDEMKRELNILKSIEFNNYSSQISNDDKPLEVLLLEKNRHLQSENTQIKVQYNDVKSKYDDEKAKGLNLLKTIGEQKQLISELERDLLMVAKNDGPKVSSSNLLNSNPTVAATILELDSGGAASEASALNEFNLSPNLSQNEAQNGQDSSLLNIVSSQRERFRLRIQELEMETISYKQQLHIVQDDIERLKGDNLKLYEKIRFLQSYEGSNEISKANKTTSRHEDENLISKYTNEYEQKHDPFTNFNRKQNQKRYANLKLHDKFTLQMGKFILGSKTARLVFCVYILIIHLLIFLCTYKMSHYESSHRDFSFECQNMFQAHMAKVHGDKDFHLPHEH